MKKLKKHDCVWLHRHYSGYQRCEVIGERNARGWPLKVIGSGDIIYRNDREFDYD